VVVAGQVEGLALPGVEVIVLLAERVAVCMWVLEHLSLAVRVVLVVRVDMGSCRAQVGVLVVLLVDMWVEVLAVVVVHIRSLVETLVDMRVEVLVEVVVNIRSLAEALVDRWAEVLAVVVVHIHNLVVLSVDMRAEVLAEVVVHIRMRAVAVVLSDMRVVAERRPALP
jgi:hypothetical protein